MKDKIILVFYVGCKMLPKYDIPYYINKLASSFDRLKDETVESIFIPCTEEVDSRVECINPKLVTEEVYDEVNKIVGDFKYHYKEFVDNINNTFTIESN